MSGYDMSVPVIFSCAPLQKGWKRPIAVDQNVITAIHEEVVTNRPGDDYDYKDELITSGSTRGYRNTQIFSEMEQYEEGIWDNGAFLNAGFSEMGSSCKSYRYGKRMWEIYDNGWILLYQMSDGGGFGADLIAS